MSRLEELIAELCPDGVEYKTLGEVATISRGGSFQKKDFLDSGFPCIHYGQIYTQYGLFAGKTLKFISPVVAEKQRKAVKNDVVMAVTSENIDDVCKCLAWLGEDEVAVSGHTAIIHHDQNPKYLTYYFHSEMFAAQKRRLAHGTKVIEVTPDKLNDVKIPLPPLEVQREIVRILDAYSERVAELTDRLAAELDARKKQYEYYHNLLLESKDIVRWDYLGNITDIKTGTKPSEIMAYGNIPYINAGLEPSGYCNLTNSIKDAITIPSRGQGGAGHVGFQNEDFWCGPLSYRIYSISEKVYTKYLYYHLKNRQEEIINLRKTGSIPAVNKEDLSRLKIPLPPLAEQERIVAILDRFDKLCNDITSGLPAEIEARRKQYEYYRDRLLTFKEKTA